MKGPTFTAIDFETATAERASACALGLVVVDAGEVVGEYGWLIRPPGNEYDGFNMMIHGIGPEDTADAPDFPAVWSEARTLIGKRMAIAHYAVFDCSVARSSSLHWEYDLGSMPIACTYRLAKLVWPERWSYRLPELAADLDLELDHHDALSDAHASAQIALRMCAERGANSISELADGFDWRLPTLGLHKTSFAQPHRWKRGPSASPPKLTPTVETFDEEHPLFGKRIAFTGTLDSMTRAEATQAALNAGATMRTSVSKKLDYLVMGWTDLSRVGKTGVSTKLRKTRVIAEQGYDLEIIDEVEFFRLLG